MTDLLEGLPRLADAPGQRMRVREMLAAGQVASRFQPIVQLSDGQVAGHEALSRGPAGSGLECPRLLFAAAADEGCELALDAACRAAALQRATAAGWAAGTDGPLFLNVRPGALARSEFLPELEAAVAAAGRAPRDVVLEVSEAERLDADLNGLLAACRSAGFWIALDDAGAGRCGLQAIADVRPDVVKVDRGLVAGMDVRRGRRAAVAALAGLARDLGIVLVAEGIETPGELRTAREIGVPLGQGYLLGRPSARIVRGVVLEAQGAGCISASPDGARPAPGAVAAAGRVRLRYPRARVRGTG